MFTRAVYLAILIIVLGILSYQSKAACVEDRINNLDAYALQLYERGDLPQFLTWKAQIHKARKDYQHIEDWTFRAYQRLNQIDIETHGR